MGIETRRVRQQENMEQISRAQLRPLQKCSEENYRTERKAKGKTENIREEVGSSHPSQVKSWDLWDDEYKCDPDMIIMISWKLGVVYLYECDHHCELLSTWGHRKAWKPLKNLQLVSSISTGTESQNWVKDAQNPPLRSGCVTWTRPRLNTWALSESVVTLRAAGGQ